jgi:hypothetical protein
VPGEACHASAKANTIAAGARNAAVPTFIESAAPNSIPATISSLGLSSTTADQQHRGQMFSTKHRPVANSTEGSVHEHAAARQAGAVPTSAESSA